MSASASEPLIYRTEVLGIIGALADLVVEVRKIKASWRTMRRKRTKAELDRIRRKAEDHPRVRLLRELEARGWSDLEARGLTPEQRQLRDLYLETRRGTVS